MTAYTVTLTDQSGAAGPIQSIIFNVATDSAADAIACVLEEISAQRILNLSTLNLADVASGGVMAGILTLTLAGSGAIAPVLPSTSGLLRITVPSGVTSVAATIAAGLVDGQSLTVDLVSSPAGLLSWSLAGFLCAANGKDSNAFNSAGISPSNEGAASANTTNPLVIAPAYPIRSTFGWSASQSAWILESVHRLDQSSVPALLA